MVGGSSKFLRTRAVCGTTDRYHLGSSELFFAQSTGIAQRFEFFQLGDQITTDTASSSTAATGRHHFHHGRWRCTRMYHRHPFCRRRLGRHDAGHAHDGHSSLIHLWLPLTHNGRAHQIAAIAATGRPCVDLGAKPLGVF